MTINPVSTSLQGLQANMDRFNRAAQQISAVAQAGGDVVDIAGAFAAMSVSEMAMAASISVIKSENEMQQRLVDMFV